MINNLTHHRNWIPGMRGRSPGARLALAIMFLPALIVPGSAQTPTYTEKVLHSFAGGSDGESPNGGLVRDSEGNLYGTTQQGGDPNCACGTVFKVDTTGKETVLYSFTGGITFGGLPNDDGATPGNLILDAQGDLYGATMLGGESAIATPCLDNEGCGTVFKMTTAGKETVLYSFTDGKDGALPNGDLVLDANGNLYGTAQGGGDAAPALCNAGSDEIGGCGTVFKVDTNGKATGLYAFTGGTDGRIPVGGVVLDAKGNLYGTTEQGGNVTTCSMPDRPAEDGCGAVFELGTNNELTPLHGFSYKPDGALPSAGLVRDANGNLFGTTGSGGDYAGDTEFVGGTVFEIDSTGKETVLYSFTGGADGSYPQGSLVLDAEGNLYGTTEDGGAYQKGTVFKLDTTGKETVLYSFGGSSGDADGPQGRLVMDAAGNLYGTTIFGGASSLGAVFKLSPGVATTTTLTSSPNPSTYGHAVVFTASVTSAGGPPPDGDVVAFMEGSTTLTQMLLNGGTVSYAISTLPVGTDSITAVFAGDSNFSASTSKAVKQVVSKSSTTTGLVSSLNPSKFGQLVTFTATVKGAFGGTPTGTVTFNHGTTALKTVSLSGGEAVFASAALPVATNSITAVYSGDSDFAASTSNPVSQVVGKAATTSTLTSSLNPSKFPQTVTFTAKVTGAYGGPPTGTIAFRDGTTVLTSVALTAGKAVFTTTSLPVGTNSITAVYSGDSDFTSSTSKAVSQVIVKSATTTALSSSLNPSKFAQTVTFTAKVTGAYGGTPAGTITFKNGTTVLTSVSLSSGVAVLTTTSLPLGTSSITAVYSGGSDFTGSTSKAVSQVVGKATTTTALASSKNPSKFEESLTFTATVTGQYGGTPTGTITFKDGTTVLKSVSLSKGKAVFTTTSLPLGTDSITALYGGNSDFGSSTSKAVKQVVGQAATTTTLVSSLNPSNSGQSVTFTATVKGQYGGTPTGTIAFKDGTTILSTVSLSDEAAKLTTPSLAPGKHSITATYNGSVDFTASSASLTQTVN